MQRNDRCKSRSRNNLRAYVSSSVKFDDLVDVVNHVRTDGKLTRPGDNFLTEASPYRATPPRMTMCFATWKSFNAGECTLSSLVLTCRDIFLRSLWDKEEREKHGSYVHLFTVYISVSSRIRVMDSATKRAGAERKWVGLVESWNETSRQSIRGANETFHR